MVFALLQVARKKGHSVEASLQKEQKMSVFRAQAQGGDVCSCQRRDKCPRAPQAGASLQKWFWKRCFCHSPCKRLNLRLRNPGTALNNSNKIMIKK